MQGQGYVEPVIDLTAGYAFFDGLFIKSGSFQCLDLDNPCPVAAEEQVIFCRLMSQTLLNMKTRLGHGLSVLDVGTGSGVLGIYAERLLNQGTDDLSTIHVLDSSSVALEFCERNVRNNNCQAINFLPRQSYSLSSLPFASQDVILMNPPFNPTHPTLLDQTAFLGSSDGFCLDVLRSWIRNANNHLKSDGVIIGCTISPVHNGSIAAVDEILEALGEDASIRVFEVNDGLCETHTFLEKQYFHYIQVVNDRERESIEEWIEEFARKYEHLTFIYFEASKKGGQGEISLPINKDLKQYDPSWERRIFLQSTLLGNAARKLADPLTEINFAEVENMVKRFADEGLHNDSLAKNAILPLAKYISQQINLQYEIPGLKYFREHIKGPFFCELVLLCPNDVDSPQEMFNFYMISSESDLSLDSARKFFGNYYSLLNFLYKEKNSILFSPKFFRSRRSDSWMPYSKNLDTASRFEALPENYLITCSDDIKDLDECAEFRNRYAIFAKEQSVVQRPNTFPLEGNSSANNYYCFDSSFLRGKDDIATQSADVPNTHRAVHSCLHDLGGFENETFMASVPIYIQESTHGEYIVAGAFIIFGELKSNEVSRKQQNNFLEMLKNFCTDMKRDLTPIIAGYAYHRSGDKRFYDSIDDFQHELRGFLSLLRPEMPPSLISTIQDICLLQFSTYTDRDAVATPNLESYIGKSYGQLIEYLISASMLYGIGRNKYLSDKLTGEAQIQQSIDQFKMQLMQMTVILEPSKGLKDVCIVDRRNINTSVQLILAALNNTYKHVHIREKQQVSIFVDKDKIRVINNYHHTKTVNRQGRTYLIMRRLRNILGRDAKASLEFGRVECSQLLPKEQVFWQSYLGEAELSTSNKELWLTQIPIAIELDL
jgi:methylase of polypeptide subunit release factors